MGKRPQNNDTARAIRNDPINEVDKIIASSYQIIAKRPQIIAIPPFTLQNKILLPTRYSTDSLRRIPRINPAQIEIKKESTLGNFVKTKPTKSPIKIAPLKTVQLIHNGVTDVTKNL